MIYHVFSNKTGEDGEDHEWPLLIEGEFDSISRSVSMLSLLIVVLYNGNFIQIYMAIHTR